MMRNLALVAILMVVHGEGAAVNKPKDSFITPPSPSRLGKYQTAAVSSDAAICSDIGRYIMDLAYQQHHFKIALIF